MPRYYFHLRTAAALHIDWEGAEFPTTDAAREEAVTSAREIIADKVRKGTSIDAISFEVTDEDGKVTDRVNFNAVVRAGHWGGKQRLDDGEGNS